MKQCSRGNILPILGRREDKKKQKGYTGSGGEKHTPEKKAEEGMRTGMAEQRKGIQG